MIGGFDTQAQQASMGDQFVSGGSSSGVPWRLMVFSIILFVFFIFVYFGVKFGYAAFLTQRKETLAADTKKLSAAISAANQEMLVNFYSQLTNLQKVTDNHVFGYNAFRLLEQRVAEGVHFQVANFDVVNSTIELDGEAVSNGALVGQLGAFDTAPEVASAVVENTKITEGGKVGFSVKVVFNRDFLAKPL